MQLRRFIFASLLLPHLAVAENIRKPTIGDDLSLVCPLVQGQQAPFSGVLISSKATAMIVSEYDYFDERLKVEVENAIKVEQIRANFALKEQDSKFSTERTTLQAKIDSQDEKLKIFEKDLQKSEANVKLLVEEMPSRTTWFGIGLVTGIVFTIATAYSIGQVVN